MSWDPRSTILLLSPNLPPHCAPTTPFLAKFSATFHTCVPTPLAFISTLLGTLSILSWLFAQLPQIIKNHRLKSTSGLSIYFLVEWCLGDMSNLGGAILTNQATWQIIVGAYYCSVDMILVSQWIWFEGLQRGQRLGGFWRDRRTYPDDPGDMQVIEGLSPGTMSPLPGTFGKQDLFNTPNYGTVYVDDTVVRASSPTRIVHAMPRRSTHPIPSPSPRTALFLTMVVALCSVNVGASPTIMPHQHKSIPQSKPPSLGTVISWASTVLYLLSRLPQLIKNIRRRSTAGLSPLLFLAAFLGNLFYSSSLLFNPCLWNDFDAYGGGGWVGAGGSQRSEWMKRALPFWLGAAGVLGMDASVGIQFWLWGGGSEESEIRELRATEQADGNVSATSKPSPPTGWMRGWIPSRGLSGQVQRLRRISPLLRPRNDYNSGPDERQKLLGSPHS